MQDSENVLFPSSQKSSIEFLTFDNQQKLCYSGCCKLQINCPGKYLTIEPINEDSKPLSAFFKWKFVKQKNILHIFSENKIQDLVLIFKNEKVCKKVLFCINKYSNNGKKNIEQLNPYQLLIPFFHQLENADILRITKCFIESLNKKEKKKFYVFLKENELYDTVVPLISTGDNAEIVKSGCLKRKRPETTEANESDHSSEDACNISVKKKVCKIKKTISKIFKKPDYEIVEGQINGIQRSRLIIFAYGEKKYCEEFSRNKRYRTYYCCGCKFLRKTVSALIHKRNTKDEYVELLNEHICEPREYKLLSIIDKKRIVNLPNFEIQNTVKDGLERKNLVIFLPNSDAKLCYKFSMHTFSQRFVCSQCQHHRHNISAKVRKNENGEDYIELSGEEVHVCKPRPYTPAESNHDIVINSADFHFFPRKSQSRLKNIQSRLFIFDDKNQKMGYEFSHTRDDIYQCLGCHLLRKQHKIVTVKMYKLNSTNEYSVRMRPNQIHFCKLRKYEPEKFAEKIIEAPMFQFYSSGKKNQESLQLIIFASEDKKLCYDFILNTGKAFNCKGCSLKKKYVSVSVCQEEESSDENNEIEYIRVGVGKHICKPIKYSEIEKRGINLLKNSGLKTKVIKIDESKIIKEPNFELRLNKAGVPNGNLIIIDSKDRTKCYEYFYRKASNRYFCCKCITVSAVIVKEGNKSSFIKLGQKEHSCQPIKYKSEKPIIRKPDFKIFNDGKRNPRLVIFTTKEQSHCYKYIYDSHNSKYYCSECFLNETRRITVKVLQDSEGNEYILQSKMDHICKPLNFNPKEFDN